MLNFLLTHTPLLYLTQSLWRDEAFSILVAQKPITFFFGTLTFEPPFYYILLHVWMNIFGSSEIAARSLSFVAFALSTVVVIFWAEKLFKKSFLSWFLPVLFFFNPMLLYYAFEVRTYGWYILFATLSMYSYMEKKWRVFILSTVLGFYTHAFFMLIPMVIAFHYLILHRKRIGLRRSLLVHPLIQSLAAIGLLISPWLLIIIKQISTRTDTWYYPVDFHLIRSVLGNIFLGYEGTPGFLWPTTFVISLILIVCFFFARNVFFSLMVFVPLILTIGISFFKPIYVNRYLIFVAIAEVFLLAFALERIKNRAMQKFAAFFILAAILLWNVWYPPLHAKVNIRSTFSQINATQQDHDVVFAKTPLVFLESIYYSSHPNRVFLYNPEGIPFPWYVGDIVVPERSMAREIPTYPNRAFLVSEDGSFIIIYITL